MVVILGDVSSVVQIRSGISVTVDSNQTRNKSGTVLPNTVVPGFRALGFSALPGFRALKASNGPWSVHKMLFGFRAPLPHLLI